MRLDLIGATSNSKKLFLDELFFSACCLITPAANMLLNFFRRVHESRDVFQKDNPAAGDIMPQHTLGCKLIHLFKGNNCKVHKKPDEEYKMEHKHFDPGTI